MAYETRTPPAKRITTHRRDRPALALGTVLPAVATNLGLERKAAEMALCALWPSVVGAHWAKHSKAVKVETPKATPHYGVKASGRQAVLVVAVSSPLVVSQLQLQQAGFLAKLNAYQQQTGIVLGGLRFSIRRQGT
jgi:hypothetical protein